MCKEAGKYAKQLEECWNNDCHEGTLTIFGKEITVFTKEPHYKDLEEEASEDGWNSGWDEEECGGQKCAFIDDTYWTGWYEQDLGNDLREVMNDIVEEIFNTHSAKFKVTCQLEEPYNTPFDPNKEYDYDEEENLPDDKLLEKITEVFKSTIENDLYGDNLQVTVDRTAGTATATFTGDRFTTRSILLDGEDSVYGGDYMENGKIECLDEDVKKFFNEAYSYTISF